MSISDCMKHEKPLPLNLLNIFNYTSDNASLIDTLHDIKIINQIIMDNSSSIEGLKKLLTNDKNITSIVINKNNLKKNEIDLLKKINGLKYLILDDNIINNDFNEGGYLFKVISKKYFANTIDIS